MTRPTILDLEASDRAIVTRERLPDFMADHIYPNERRHYVKVESLSPWTRYPVIDELKLKARTAGIWNIFSPPDASDRGFFNLDYTYLCEVMGRSLMASEILNCLAPDTGNMEVLYRYGTEAQQHEAVVDDAIQLFGGGDTGNDHFITAAYAIARVLRLPDGPDEAHRTRVAKLELAHVLPQDAVQTGATATSLSLDEMRETAAEGLWPPLKEQRQ
ncbi:acyl-CoA dehydrogenase family protein [Nitrobacter sp.]|uniref:acyl-CoA dehydrogenase family protein n=1 Tax=Nitrobacter sp. TaxID=29420 RepID=UPI0029CABCC9|nr:acyl-CoA dehydrogenase family protein [Nitrobacter sp.]